MTYIILDIDGVLNPFYARYNPDLNFTWLAEGNQGLFLKPDMHTRWLQKLSEHATIIWGSAWEKESNLVLRLLNIDDTWGWIPLDREDVGLGTWKLKSIKPWVESLPTNEKVVWLDDELESDVFIWAQERGNMLALAPNRAQGLTEEDFQRVYDFVVS
jgi:hypothetical protein